MNTYFTFNEKGARPLPEQAEIEFLRREGFEPILVLDSNICLDMVKYANYAQKATINKKKLLHFLDYLRSTGLRTFQILGLLELSHDRERMIWNHNKFMDLKYKIDFLEQIPLKVVNKGTFDFQRDYRIMRRPVFSSQSMNAHSPLLYCSYAHLLKIRQIARKGLGKKLARRNMDEYMDWVLNDFNRAMKYESALAMNVFGGISEFRKMIWLEGKLQETKKKLWGSCWDLFHARMCSNDLAMSESMEENLKAIFVTNDKNLFQLAAKMTLQGIFGFNDCDIETSMSFNFDSFPHFADNDIDDFNQNAIMALSERFNKDKPYNEAKVLQTIRDLEVANEIADQ